MRQDLEKYCDKFCKEALPGFKLGRIGYDTKDNGIKEIQFISYPQDGIAIWILFNRSNTNESRRKLKYVDLDHSAWYHLNFYDLYTLCYFVRDVLNLDEYWYM